MSFNRKIQIQLIKTMISHTQHEFKYLFICIIIFVAIPLTSISLISFPVYAHPIPILFKPKPNEIIDIKSSVPNEIIISFTERLESKASVIKVMDSNNTRVDNNDLKLKSDKVISVSLDKSKLKTGIFTVYWLVLSKDDGFITKGLFYFSIVKEKNHYTTE